MAFTLLHKVSRDIHIKMAYLARTATEDEILRAESRSSSGTTTAPKDTELAEAETLGLTPRNALGRSLHRVSEYQNQSTAAEEALQNLRQRYLFIARAVPKKYSHSIQITCLFWFESASTIKHAEELSDVSFVDRGLVPDAAPSIGFRKWVTTILTTTLVSKNVILLALLFIYRLKKFNPGVSGKRGSEFRLFTIALMLGNKCM